MGSTSPIELPALKTNPKFIFFTDFDGTITQQDSNDFITDNLGFGQALRRKLNEDVLYGRTDFRDAFRDMLDSINAPFDQCIEVLKKNINLDPGFKAFFEWAKENNIPIVVLSGGMEPIIRALLAHMLGAEAADTLQIVSNHVAPREGKDINEVGGWQIVFRDESGFGHDKSREIRPYANLPAGERPVLFYAGDGVSDLSAAKETDLLFAKAGRDLVKFCENENVPFTTFNDFSDIHATVKDIVEGRLGVKEAAIGRKKKDNGKPAHNSASVYQGNYYIPKDSTRHSPNIPVRHHNSHLVHSPVALSHRRIDRPRECLREHQPGEEPHHHHHDHHYHRSVHLIPSIIIIIIILSRPTGDKKTGPSSQANRSRNDYRQHGQPRPSHQLDWMASACARPSQSRWLL
ncbi:hypothetical protein VTJ49DRAFT_2737 [Mycothermus thermophilus]|uniref:Phosphoserine phosphatase n=1 Tax=Humicola insolens TaxID=85995 RepID=A0ABR3VMZ6_HUMIN